MSNFLSHFETRSEDEDIRRLTEELDLELARQHVPNSDQSTESRIHSRESSSDATVEKKESLQLFEHIQRERRRRQAPSTPEQQMHMRTIDKYVLVKTNQFEFLEKQKGLQLNKAA